MSSPQSQKRGKNEIQKKFGSPCFCSIWWCMHCKFQQSVDAAERQISWSGDAAKRQREWPDGAASNTLVTWLCRLMPWR